MAAELSAQSHTATPTVSGLVSEGTHSDEMSIFDVSHCMAKEYMNLAAHLANIPSAAAALWLD